MVQKLILWNCIVEDSSCLMILSSRPFPARKGFTNILLTETSRQDSPEERSNLLNVYNLSNDDN